MSKCSAIVITQCCQRDYLAPSREPTRVFVGASESRRVVPQLKVFLGLVASLSLPTIHIRDWHDEEKDAEHLEHFGIHCLENTPGAAQIVEASNDDRFVNANSLNDVLSTDLMTQLREMGADSGTTKCVVIGCWSDAKVMFLCYELTSRGFQVATSSALTASSCIQRHYAALNQLEKTLGVSVFHGVTDLLDWVTGGKIMNLQGEFSPGTTPEIEFNDGELSATEIVLIRLSYPESKAVKLKTITGGYSGARVLRVEATMANSGISEAPTMLKIGQRDSILKEHMNCLSVEAALGNNVPRVLSFADVGELAIIKFAFAALFTSANEDSPTVRSFSEVYQKESAELVENILGVLFSGVLVRIYRPTIVFGPCDFFGKDWLDFDGKGWSWGKGGTDVPERVSERIESLLPGQGWAESISILEGFETPSVVLFLRNSMMKLVKQSSTHQHLSCTVHGDLHPGNVIIDANQNVFVIDMAYTGQGPLLKDQLKMEADLMYVHTLLESDQDLKLALKFSDFLAAISDLGELLPEEHHEFANVPAFDKLYRSVGKIRKSVTDLVGPHRSTVDASWIRLRYALHALTFEYLKPRQRIWALYDACLTATDLQQRKRFVCLKLGAAVERRGDGPSNGLPILPTVVPEYQIYSVTENLSISYLPGRIDRSSSVADDVAIMVSAGNFVNGVQIATTAELSDFDCNAQTAYEKAGIKVFTASLLSGSVPTRANMQTLLSWIRNASGKTLIVSLAGLGRAGLVCACYLKAETGMSAKEAAEHLRSVRCDDRAIETAEQEEFLENY